MEHITFRFFYFRTLLGHLITRFHHVRTIKQTNRDKLNLVWQYLGTNKALVWPFFGRVRTVLTVVQFYSSIELLLRILTYLLLHAKPPPAQFAQKTCTPAPPVENWPTFGCITLSTSIGFLSLLTTVRTVLTRPKNGRTSALFVPWHCQMSFNMSLTRLL